MMVQACHSSVDSLDNYINTKRTDLFKSQSSFYTTYIDTIY